LAEETVAEIEQVLHRTERPSRGRFHQGRGKDYRHDMVEMAISEIGLCSGHSGSGVWVNEKGETTVPGLYAAGDMACVPHGYMLGAFTYGKISALNAVEYIGTRAEPLLDEEFIAREKERVFRPLANPGGIPPHQLEYKIRRLVNDYLQPPKTALRMEQGLEHFLRARAELEELGAAEPHDLMRAAECGFILDCAEMAARASLYRKESRWGLYHYRLDYPEMDNANWFVHANLKRGADGSMLHFTRPIDPYVVPLDEKEMKTYQHLRIEAGGTAETGLSRRGTSDRIGSSARTEPSTQTAEA
jgi:succinate dehydrogenase/fumarate reductase flavoprotein subunit